MRKSVVVRPQQQLTFPQFNYQASLAFGGSLLKNSNAKIARPISTKKPMHLVLRSSVAIGKKSFLRSKFNARIRAIIRKQAQINGVKIYGVANKGNHFHLLLLPRSRKAYLNFVRAISGLIARVISGAERGKALSKAADSGQRTAASLKSKKFWDQRPFTRIIEWGRNLNFALRVFESGRLVAIGFAPYFPHDIENTS